MTPTAETPRSPEAVANEGLPLAYCVVDMAGEYASDMCAESLESAQEIARQCDEETHGRYGPYSAIPVYLHPPARESPKAVAWYLDCYDSATKIAYRSYTHNAEDVTELHKPLYASPATAGVVTDAMVRKAISVYHGRQLARDAGMGNMRAALEAALAEWTK